MKKVLLYFILILFVAGCKHEEPTPKATTTDLKITFRLVDNGSAYTLNNPLKVGSNPRFYLNTFLFYVNQPTLVKSDGSLESISDVFLIDFDPNIEANNPQRDKNRDGTSFTYTLPNGTYSALKFGLGADPAINGTHYNPSSFTAGHPYSSTTGMAWDVWKAYRHIRVEGQIDTSASQMGSFDLPITWHTGFDSLYREVTIANNLSLTGTATQITILVDVDKLLNNKFRIVKLPAENYTEMATSKDALLGIKLTDNLKDAMSIQ